jgi:hypothetical protein
MIGRLISTILLKKLCFYLKILIILKLVPSKVKRDGCGPVKNSRLSFPQTRTISLHFLGNQTDHDSNVISSKEYGDTVKFPNTRQAKGKLKPYLLHSLRAKPSSGSISAGGGKTEPSDPLNPHHGQA